MSKKMSYKKLLTEAIAEFDTSKTVEVKGPMLDPIVSWDGGGELTTNKDAASVLERYYFKQDQDEGVEVVGEADDTETTKYTAGGAEVKGKGEEHTQGAGTEQAGTTSDAKKMDKREKEIAKEEEEVTAEGEEEVTAEGEEVAEGEESVTEDIEDAIIEKLIAEMEGEDEEEEDEEATEESAKITEQDEEEEGEKDEEVEEGEIMAGKKDWEGVAPGSEAPKEKEMKDTEQHAKGAGTEQAGTGDAEGQIPPRKDLHDKFVKPKQYTDEGEDLSEQEDEEEKGDEDEDLDVDKKMAESGQGAVPPPSMKRKMDNEDQGEYDDIDEAFQIFKEEMEEEPEEEPEED